MTAEPRLPALSPEQIAIRVDLARQRHANYLDFVERCARLVQQAQDLGWQVTLALNGERAVRGAESLLGVHLRHDFARSTPLSRLIYGV